MHQQQLHQINNSFITSKSASLTNSNILSNSPKISNNSGFFNQSTEMNSFGQFYKQEQTSQLDRQSAWLNM